MGIETEKESAGPRSDGESGGAELALASGDYVEGLRIHREAAARMRAMRLPGVALTGLEPWVLFGDSVALAAHARYAEGADLAQGRALFLTCRENAIRAFGTPIPGFDYPAAGQLLFALGAWALFRRAAPAESALRLLALAHRFEGWAWLFLSGLVTFVLGVMVWRRWPTDSLWVIGLFVAYLFYIRRPYLPEELAAQPHVLCVNTLYGPPIGKAPNQSHSVPDENFLDN